ncbi:hypothetical protein SAMN05421504_11545 [Amycolatopsis xylanica]|uniref:Uncharacterized protein n=1 Tax=Amycolatopsis xylanica TaxID=589385 RepID=A0A1H3SR44_9PSEU|nr:hypothetical protein [Amycolatopsis xylanica]SDZ40476.1 hypothetical protein SAMN05421504_11545 [Amycolatopsis xylanica]
MGASGWAYRGKFDGDPERTLAEIQQRIFLDDDYLWEDDEEPRPSSIEELLENEVIEETGTHSALDVTRFIGAGEEFDFGTIRPMSSDEILAAFGTAQPAIADFERLKNAEIVPDLPHWSAVYTPLYADGIPVELGIWGISGD